MDDLENLKPPKELIEIQKEGEALGFTMASEEKTGSILRTLAASKPGGTLLEIGTGTGVAACWMLDGMDKHARLITIELNEKHNAIAKKHFGEDSRIEFVTGNAEEFLQNPGPQRYDLIFADSMPGKFYLRDEALALLKSGGFYIIDDLLPQPGWVENHEDRVKELIAALESRPDLQLTKLAWASGLIIVTKING